jgi:O-antigen biosynthesis protein
MKDKLLVIAPFLPRYDRNSGDLRLFSILKILSLSYEITYLTKGLPEESDEVYLSSLEELGVKVSVGTGFPLVDILRRNRFCAAILEFYYVAEDYLPKLRILQPKCPIIIDSVDVHYYRAFSKYNITGNKEDLQKAEEIKIHELGVYDRSDMVITVTSEDAEILKNDRPTLATRAIPNIHNVDIIGNAPDKNSLIFVGGFAHDPNIDAVLYFCNQVLPLLRETIPDIKFTIVGSNPPDQIKQFNSPHIEVTGHVPSTIPYLHHNYISVAPLRYGAGMKGKIGEAMALGRPVVTTSIGAQGMGLTDRENIMISNSSEEFANSIVELIRNEDLYKTIQLNAANYIKSRYSPARVGADIQTIMSELMTMSVKKMPFSEKTAYSQRLIRGFVKKRLMRSRENI